MDQLEELDRFARKSAENLYAAIQRARRRPLARILNALGIPQVGEQTAIDLTNWLLRRMPPAPDEPMGEETGAHGWTWRVAEELRRLAVDSPDAFSEVSGIGPTVGASIARYFSDPVTAGILAEIVAAGVEAERPDDRAIAAAAAAGAGVASGPLAGRTVVVTGSLEGFDRQGAEDAIRAAGGKSRRLGVEEDRLSRRGRERRFEAGQGAGARHPDPRRGRLQAAAGGRGSGLTGVTERRHSRRSGSPCCPSK